MFYSFQLARSFPNNRIIMESKTSVHSVGEMLYRLKENQQPFFYIGRMYCNMKLHFHDFFHKYEIISCFDPFKGRFPFVKVPQSITLNPVQHRCCDLDDCLLLLLRDPEVISYIKSSGKHPRAVLVSPDPEGLRICREAGIEVWGPSSDIYNFLGNKVKIVEVLKKAEIPFIPNVLSPINSYQQIMELGKIWNTSRIVVQAAQGSSGYGTYFVNSEEDYNKYSKDLEDGQVKKIMPFKRLRSFGLSGIAGKVGTVLGPMHSELIGHAKLTPFPAGFCGNQLRKDYFEDEEAEKKVRHDVYKYAERFGDYIYKQENYRGIFGMDFVVDMDSFEVFLMEVNPRQSAGGTLAYQYYQADGHRFPLYLFGCAEWMGFDLKFDVKALNQQWERTDLYSPSACHLAIKGMNIDDQNLNITAPGGIYILKEGELHFTGRFSFLIQELKEEEAFFLPSRGFAKGHLILRGNCQQSSGKLTAHTELLICKFLSLLYSSIQ